MIKPLPTQKRLRELFEYVDGTLIRKTAPNGRVKVGDTVGSLRRDLYSIVRIDYKSYYLHRLIYLYHEGHMPKYIDHIDGNKQNNRIDNLRPATRSQNAINTPKLRNNTSGFKGVSRGPAGVWRSTMMLQGQRYDFGQFIDKIDAAQAYNLAACTLQGDFARYNGLIDSEAYGLF